MMKHFLHRYSGNTQFEVDYNGANYEEPWVSVTDGDGNGRVNYNKSEEEKMLGTPLTFKITSNGTILFTKSNTIFTPTVVLQYKKNDEDWVSFSSSTVGITINAVAGDKVMFRGNNTQYAFRQGSYNTFAGSTAGFTMEGNIMSLINSENFANLTALEGAYTFENLFAGCTGLTDVSNLVLPATTLTNRCYATMFSNCTSLTTAPELPATTLTGGCYFEMFRNCTSLTTAPALPATTLAVGCYNYMFEGCTNLNYIKAMFMTTPGADYTSAWVSGVATSGTFVKNSNATWDVTGGRGIPTGWTVETA